MAAGYTVGEIFVDNGVSGMGDRPGLAALRACIEDGRAQVVVTTDPARIARDLAFLIEQERFFGGNGIKLVYVDLPEGHRTIVDVPIQELRRLNARRAAATRAREAQ